MKIIYWNVQENILLLVRRCRSCNGYAWYVLGEETSGIWQDLGCGDTVPAEDEYVEIESHY